MRKEMIEKYAKEYGERFYKRSKRKFQNTLLSDFEELGYTGEVIKKRSKLSFVENVYVGNPKSAKVGIVVPYNTPSKVFWFKNNYYPQDGYVNMKNMFIPTYVPIFLGYAFLLLIIYLLPMVLPASMFVWIYPVAIGYLILFMVFMIKGFANRKNYANNSASIVAALELAESLDKQSRKEVMFLFTDGNKTNRASGNKPMLNYLEDKKKINLSLITLFCMGQKDTIRLSYDKKTKGLSKDLIKEFKGTTSISSETIQEQEKYNSVVDGLPQSLMISSGVINDSGLMVKNVATSKDNEVDDTVVEDVKEMLRRYITKKK